MAVTKITAGYMKKLQGYVYDGSHIANEDLYNGMFAEIASNEVKRTASAKDTKMRVAEKTSLWGKDAVVLDVVSVGNDEVFLVENEWDINDNVDYNTAEYKIEKGDFVRMHRPLPGEQMIITVDSSLYGSQEVGGTVQPTTDGTIASVG